LIIFLAAIIALLFFIVMISFERNFVGGNAVEITDGNSTELSLELRLGDLEHLKGHDIKIIKLHTDAPSRGFKSDYYFGSSIRNVVFLTGPQLNARWLYETHNYLISCFCNLSQSNEFNSDNPVLAIYVTVSKADTNGDGVISKDDEITLALSSVDGSEYREVESGITKVFDSTVSAQGDTVSFLLQIGRSIVVQNYSLTTFERISERTIDEISKKL